MALSPFEHAFASARSQGLPVFEFQGKLFTTELAEEPSAPQQVEQPMPSSVPSPTPGGAQQSMQQSPAGQVMGAAARISPSDLLSQISQSAQDIMAGNEGNIATNIPAFARVKQSFKDADQQGKAQGLDLVERDVFRHKQGSREATLSQGFLAALLGSQGHEANTIAGTVRNVVKGLPFDKTSPTGQLLSPGRYVAESVQDSINNLLGQAEALISELGLETDLGSVSIDRPDTKMAGFGSSLEEGVNKLAGLVNVFQEKLAEAKKGAENAESQV